jgi:hypothetical protein
MNEDFLVNVLIIVLIVILLYFLAKQTLSKEGFATTLQDLVQDRTNPMAASQNPLTNPAAAIGITESSGDSIRKLTTAALNVPMQVPVSSTSGVFKPQLKFKPTSARIDNENSLLGLVKFCKEYPAKNPEANPFINSKFAENCGMCMTSGSLVTGERFTTPTGVVVYKADKERFYKRKADNSYRFARAIPSVKSALCIGATIDDDSIVPVLPIDADTYDDIQRRNLCRTRQEYGNGCGTCVKDSSSWSYVKFPPKGGIYDISILFYGLGFIEISVAGGAHSSPIPLGSTVTSLNLSAMARNQGVTDFSQNSQNGVFQINLKPPTSGEIPSFFALLQGMVPNGKIFSMKIEESIRSNFRALTPVFFSDVQLTLANIVPFPGQTTLILDCKLPVTFVQPDQIASYDCMTGPFTTSADDATMLTDDPCLRPSGQGPNTYSIQCINSKIFAAGCSTDGDWYMNGLPASATVGKTIGQISSWLASKITNVNTDPVVAKGCYGEDITTPCDQFNDGKSIPDQACLTYLYSNGSGDAYPNLANRFTSLRKKDIQFCQPAGLLNPSKPQGLYELQKNAAGYKGYKGIDAVKAYLSDTFTKAVGNLSLDKEDGAGGRLTSWIKCFGIPIDPLPNVVIPPPTVITPPFQGEQVYCTKASGNKAFMSIEVGTRNSSPWYGWGGWENNAPPPGNGVYWIWSTENANLDAPRDAYVSFEYNYCNTRDVKEAIISATADNEGSLYVNNVVVSSGTYVPFSPSFPKVTVRLKSGVNKLRLVAVNRGGPAGIWLVMRNAQNGEILAKTDNTWVWSNQAPPRDNRPPPPPGPPPPPPPPKDCISPQGSGVTIREHCDNTGWSQMLRVGDHDITKNPGLFPPNMSYIIVPKGFVATIYTGSIGQGQSKSFIGPAEWSFCTEGWWANDKIRSVRVAPGVGNACY